MSETKQPPSIQELFDLSGKVALVTGGGGYLGTAFASALAEVGARVVVTSRDQGRADAAAAMLPDAQNVGHLGVVLDHMEPASIERCVETIDGQVGPIDILVNNGHEPTSRDLTEVSPEEFSRQLANATGYFQLARHVHDQALARTASASVIMIGSMYGQVASYPDAYECLSEASPLP